MTATTRHGLRLALVLLLVSGCRTDIVGVDIELTDGDGCDPLTLGMVTSVAVQVRTRVGDTPCILTSVCPDLGSPQPDFRSLAEFEAALTNAPQPLLDVPLESADEIAVVGFRGASCEPAMFDPLMCGAAEPDDATSDGRLAIETDCRSLGNQRCEPFLLEPCR